MGAPPQGMDFEAARENISTREETQDKVEMAGNRQYEVHRRAIPKKLFDTALYSLNILP